MVKYLAERHGSAIAVAGPESGILYQVVACKRQKTASPHPARSTGKSEAGTRNPAGREEQGITATCGHRE
jgi:hypothetical protein